MRFEWDERKDRSNQRKHGVAFEEAAEVFVDPLHVSWLDERFSAFEERWVTVGQTTRGVTLTVANLFFDERGDEVVRVISARRATNREREAYERAV
jgi:uncharacterized DUF497 family protein